MLLNMQQMIKFCRCLSDIQDSIVLFKQMYTLVHVIQ